MTLHITMGQYIYLSHFPLYTHVIKIQKPVPLHTHSFTELAIVIEGTASHRIDDNKYPVSAGDVYLILGDKKHCFEDAKDLVISNVMFDPAALELPYASLRQIPGFRALFELEPRVRKSHQFQSRLKLMSEQMERLLKLQADLELELKTQDAGYKMVAKSTFLYMLCFLGRCYSAMPDRRTRALSSIGGVLNYLEKNYERPISAADLRLQSFMSESTLLRRFKEATSNTPVGYLNQLRIKKACDLLLKTNMSITAIAFEVGFNGSDYFARRFRKMMNVSPREYRRRG